MPACLNLSEGAVTEASYKKTMCKFLKCINPAGPVNSIRKRLNFSEVAYEKALELKEPDQIDMDGMKFDLDLNQINLLAEAEFHVSFFPRFEEEYFYSPRFLLMNSVKLPERENRWNPEMRLLENTSYNSLKLASYELEQSIRSSFYNAGPLRKKISSLVLGFQYFVPIDTSGVFDMRVGLEATLLLNS